MRKTIKMKKLAAPEIPMKKLAAVT